jgi:monoamine oxidase
MSNFNKSVRSPLLRTIQKSFALMMESKKPNSPAFNELIQQAEEAEGVKRRQFISGVAKASMVLSLGSIFEACKKADMLMKSELSDTTQETNYNAKAAKIQPRIAIVGAGIAGLSCAYKLKKSGLTSTVYESSSRTGGRILTKQNFIAQGLYTECGGEFIDTGHKKMLKLASDFGLSLVDTQVASETALAKDSFYMNGQFYNETAVMQAFAPYSNQIASDISSLPTNFDYQTYNATINFFDQMSISGYLDYIGMPSNSFLRQGIEVAYNTEYGREVTDQTAINFLFLFSINPGNNKYEIFGASDERYKILGGNQQIVDGLYNDVSSQVIMNSGLTKITKNTSGVYTLYFNNNTTVDADMVVLTIPFTILKNVDLSNLALPSWKTNAIQNLGYGTNAKLIMGFNNRVWRSFNQSGYIFTNGINNNTPYIQTGWDSGQLQPSTTSSFTVFQGGTQGTNLSLAQSGTFINQLNTMWCGMASAYNGVSKLIHWPSFQHSLGSYACWRVGQVSTIKGAEGQRVDKLFFAGEHTSGNNQGYMEGGAETGMDVANVIAKYVKTGVI